MSLLNVQRDIMPIGPEPILQIGNFSLSNSSMFIFFIIILFIALYIFSIRKFKERPDSGQSIIEMMYEGIVSFIEQITGSKEHAKVVLPVVGTMFVFLGVSNLIGLFPGLTAITVGDVSLFRSPTADFNTTFTLAVGSVIALHFIGVKEWGLWGHLGKFFKVKEVIQGFKGGLKKGVMSLIDFGIGLLDIIGEVAKVVSLSLRLFGNMYAGEVLAIIIMGGLAWIVPSLWTAMNVLVGVIQALVFGSLVAAYYMLAIKPREMEVGR